MELETVVGLISESADRLVKAAKISKKDEKLWAAIAKEDWDLIQLSWKLRGVILRRGMGAQAASELNGEARKQIDEILKKAKES